MPRHSDLARLDWTEIGRRAVGVGAEALAESARRRTEASPGAITHAVTQDDRATITVSDPALIRRERGDVGRAPMPFLAPDASDHRAVLAAMVASLRKDLS
jgi:hypothetical protein